MTSLQKVLVGLALIAATGCAEVADDVSFRQIELGDLEFEVHEGPNTSQEGCLTWSIGFSDTFRPPGQAESEPVRLASFDQSGIQSASSDESCSFEGAQLVGDTGIILFTVDGRRIYAGDTTNGDPLYRIAGTHVLEGTNGPPLLTATINLQQADTLILLLLAALIEGECGGNGLDPDEPPPPQ